MPLSIASIREQVVLARLALLKNDIAGGLLRLESAALGMRGLGADTSKSEVEALRVDLARVAMLARNGEEFWRSWGRLVGVEPGYTPAGVLAEAPAASRIAVEG